MATNYPSGTDNLTNPAGTSVVTSPDHAAQHTNINDAMEAVQTTAGTTAGTNVLKHFAAGEFPVRATGVAATGTLVQTVVGGTYNANTIGTPAITGGTYSNTMGTVSTFNKGTLGSVASAGGTFTSPTINNSIIGTPALTGGTIILDNNVALQAKDSGGTAQPLIKLNSSNVIVVSNLYEQYGGTGSVTNTLKSNQLIQRGWGWVQGDNTGGQEKTVTFPTPFANGTIDIMLNYLGAKTASGTPTQRTDEATAFSALNLYVIGSTIGSSSFNVGVILSTGTVANTFRNLFSWIAVGDSS